jgi:hypothetical protein
MYSCARVAKLANGDRLKICSRRSSRVRIPPLALLVLYYAIFLSFGFFIPEGAGKGRNSPKGRFFKRKRLRVLLDSGFSSCMCHQKNRTR